MSNPLFNMFGNPGQNTQSNGPFSNLANVMNQFNQFKSTFQGDPQQKVQELLKSGHMSQEQFDQLSGMAQVFRSLIR